MQQFLRRASPQSVRCMLWFNALPMALLAPNKVAVIITTKLDAPPREARKAWLEYAWERGGGLPGTAMILSEDFQTRTLLPVFLKEEIVPTNEDNCILSRHANLISNMDALVVILKIM